MKPQPMIWKLGIHEPGKPATGRGVPLRVAMVAVELKHSNLAQHQASIFKQLQTFRKEGQLCDVVVKSCDDIEHRAHTAVLCAASMDLKNMLVGQFREANQVQQGQPVEMAASDSVVEALLEYIYGEEPQIELEDSLELLRLAEAYNFPELAAAIKGGLSAALDTAPVGTALKVLRQTQGFHELQDACEDKLAANFELCIEPDGLLDFCELSSGQLGRILRRADLKVSREEQVVKGLFKWFNGAQDRSSGFGALLQNIDFQSISSSNLARLGQLSLSIAMGPVLHDLQRQSGEALQAHKKRSAELSLLREPAAFRPKRECFLHWSPDLGASVRAPQKVLPHAMSMCCHDGAIYFTKDHTVFRWTPGDAESQAVAGRGAPVNGVNDLGQPCIVSVSSEGEIFVLDLQRHRLLSFANGCGKVVLSDASGVEKLACCPSSGAVYLLTVGDVEKLVGETRHPVISFDFPEEEYFCASDLFITKDEVIYVSDQGSGRIFRLNPGEVEPVVVGEVPNVLRSRPSLFVTEDEKIYVADEEQQVWAFHPGDTTRTEVLTCPRDPGQSIPMMPSGVLVQGGSLYVSMFGSAEGIYEYLLPPELQLE